MKLSDLKYGFLISATTLFGAAKVQMFAQNTAGNLNKIESKALYKKQFMQSVSPERPTISVEFMIDSVKNITSNGNLLPDINVIQLFAELDDEEDEEYLDAVRHKLAAAHEMWHRTALMNGVLEKPMSATHFRTGQDNFEISASLVALLTFRDIYLNASPEQRQQLHRLTDPKVKMYLLAVDNDIIRPVSNDKKDFDFEMKFMAQMVASFWNNTMSSSYADYHNMLTENSGRKEMTLPVYEQNFLHDIKLMNTIGGIDFSQYYDFRDIHNRKIFPKGKKEDKAVLSRSLDEPNYEAWINEKSQLKRYSKQKIELPNFVAARLSAERQQRELNGRPQPYKIMPVATGYKSYPKMEIIFFNAIELKKGTETFKFFPCGTLDKISKPDEKGYTAVTTIHSDGSFEKGTLLKGRKDGTFVYYDKNKKEVSRCLFKNGTAVNGTMLFPFNNTLFVYTYKNGKLKNIEDRKLYGKMPQASLLHDFTANPPLVAQSSFHDLPVKATDKKKAAKTPLPKGKLIKFEPVYREVSDKTKVSVRKNIPSLHHLKQNKR